jgi:hypothetical protein
MTTLLSINSIIATLSVGGKNLHGHRLYLPTYHGDLFLVLIIISQLRSETESMCFPVEYLHKNFNQSFIKYNIIST